MQLNIHLPQTQVGYIITLGLLAALGPLCTDLYLAALPDIAIHLKTNTSMTQLSLTASLLGLGIGQLIIGPASDKLGRKIPLQLSLLLMVFTSIGCGLVQSIDQLIIIRFIQGIAGAGGIVLSRAIARDLYTASALTRFFSLLMAVNGIAPILAPVLGSSLLLITTWRGIFFILAVITIILFLLSQFQIIETLPPEQRAHGRFWNALPVMGQLLTHKKFMAPCLAQGFSIAGMFAYIGAASFVLQNMYHLSAQAFSYCFAINGIGLILSAQLSSYLSRKSSESHILITALGIGLIGATLLVICALSGASLWWVLPILFVTIMINSAVGTMSATLSMQSIPPQEGGSASALLGLLMFGFGAISAPMTGIGHNAFIAMAITIWICYFSALLNYRLIDQGSSSIKKPA
ncbi:multidrug effflux MFS transporter [Celerinatantimonas sp. YJH-8]|uniref:multidrug effflux MFS transporter n=1 Tax=Celerinatantimonas sp. YJH-8 TaxID=3228714 RepID=UPI0038BEA5AB